MSEQQGSGAMPGSSTKGVDEARRDAIIHAGANQLAAVWGTQTVNPARVRRVPEQELVGWVVEYAQSELRYQEPEMGRVSLAPRMKAGDVVWAFDAWVAEEKGLDDVGLGPQKLRDLVVDVLRSAGVRYVASGRYFQGLTWNEDWASVRSAEGAAGQSLGVESTS